MVNLCIAQAFHIGLWSALILPAGVAAARSHQVVDPHVETVGRVVCDGLAAPVQLDT